MPRREYEAGRDSLAAEMKAFASRLDKAEGSKGGTAQAIAWGAAALGTLIAIAAIVVSIVTH